MGAVDKRFIIEEAINSPIDFVMNGSTTRLTIFGVNMIQIFNIVAIIMLISCIVMFVRRIKCGTYPFYNLGGDIMFFIIGISIYRFTSIFLYLILGGILFWLFTGVENSWGALLVIPMIAPFLIPMIAFTIFRGIYYYKTELMAKEQGLDKINAKGWASGQVGSKLGQVFKDKIIAEMVVEVGTANITQEYIDKLKERYHNMFTDEDIKEMIERAKEMEENNKQYEKSLKEKDKELIEKNTLKVEEE